MASAILLLLATGIVWGMIGVLFGRAPSEKDKLYTWFALNGMVFTGLVLLTRTPDPAPVSEILRLSLYIAPSAILDLLAFLVLKLAMDRGSQGVAWCVMQSAMVVPFLGALIFLGNTASVWQWAGMGLIIISLLIFGFAKQSKEENKQSDKLFYRYIFLAFALVGVAQFLRIIPGSVGFSEETLSWRLTLQAPYGMIFWLCACWKIHKFTPKPVWKQALLYGFVVALGHALFYLGTDAADKLKLTSIIYPMTLGTCIAFFSLYCFFVRKEQVSKLSWVAMAATVSGIALMAIR
ncbi:MAG: hypothetical protein IKD46_07515 [Lentisphaeria bacterium]|nr:hypothetical protein [Lentisphaeria bacterium]